MVLLRINLRLKPIKICRSCLLNSLAMDHKITINIFKIIDTHISFYSRTCNTHLLPPKPKSSFRHLKRGIQDFHMNYVLVPADKAANNVVVV